jgi:hypothetical protein
MRMENDTFDVLMNNIIYYEMLTNKRRMEYYTKPTFNHIYRKTNFDLSDIF